MILHCSNWCQLYESINSSIRRQPELSQHGLGKLVVINLMRWWHKHWWHKHKEMTNTQGVCLWTAPHAMLQFAVLGVIEK